MNTNKTKTYSDMWLYILFGLSICFDIYCYFWNLREYASLFGTSVFYVVWFLIARGFHHKLQNKMPNIISTIISMIFGYYIPLVILMFIERFTGIY